MATYVPLDMPTIAANAAYTETVNFQAAVAEALADSSNSFIQSLADLKDTDFFTVGDLPVYTPTMFYSGGLASAAYARPDRPAGLTPPNIDALISRMNSLVAPSAPDVTFEYTDTGYASAMRDPLIAKLLADLLNGGYGIDTNDESRLWNRARDRESRMALANIEEVKRQFASTSFALPPGAMYVAIEKARQQYLEKVSTVNRDIALKRADLYVDNRRRVIEQVLATESQSIALYNAVQGRQLEIARTEVAMAIALFEAGVNVFSTQLEAVTKQIAAQMEYSRTAAAAFNSDIQMYATYVNALVADSQAYIQNQRNLLERDKVKVYSNVEQVKFRLGQLAATVDNAKDINRYGAEFFRTGFGSSINGINALAVQTKEVT